MKIIDELDQIGLNLDMDFETETKSKDELIIGESNKRQSCSDLKLVKLSKKSLMHQLQ